MVAFDDCFLIVAVSANGCGCCCLLLMMDAGNGCSR
jgi:hypothetical protein